MKERKKERKEETNKQTNKQRQTERITQQDAKHQSEVVVLLTRVSKRIQFDSVLGNSSKITTGK
jgi:hypothetical protein